MKVRTIKEIPDDKGGVWPVGTEREAVDAFWWLKLGVAEPVDDEAIEFQKTIDQQRARAKALVTRQAQEAIALHNAQQKEAEDAKHAEFEAMLKEGM